MRIAGELGQQRRRLHDDEILVSRAARERAHLRSDGVAPAHREHGYPAFLYQRLEQPLDSGAVQRQLVRQLLEGPGAGRARVQGCQHGKAAREASHRLVSRLLHRCTRCTTRLPFVFSPEIQSSIAACAC
ncbi:MAG: hypothetical protein A3D95_10385 [Betaproteobacteria bacterium RIFCSPHIGHO2_12_FULL_69_13]|nr:MAG: hypothetical protein A3D95_10385 [Betaproteobacteria bacterium RIFCSPHIGHO2_12_FULL_69_13]